MKEPKLNCSSQPLSELSWKCRPRDGYITRYWLVWTNQKQINPPTPTRKWCETRYETKRHFSLIIRLGGYMLLSCYKSCYQHQRCSHMFLNQSLISSDLYSCSAHTGWSLFGSLGATQLIFYDRFWEISPHNKKLWTNESRLPVSIDPS